MVAPLGQLRIGTSGYNYKHWKEIFYPKTVTQKKWLSFYAGHFNTVELNTTFYRKPTVAAVENWLTQVPPDFTFAVKMWRGITHFRQLLRCADLLEKFLPLIDPIPPSQRGPLLVQLVQRTKLNISRLEIFLSDLAAVMARQQAPWRVAFEFRDRSWLVPEVYRLLDAHRAAVCLHDMAGSVTTEPNAADFVYMRRHGGAGKYFGNYTPAQGGADAIRIREWLAQGRSVWVYFNNDIHGHALADARRLSTLLSLTPQFAQS